MRALMSVVVAAAVLVGTAGGAANAAAAVPGDTPGAIFTFKADEGAHPVGGRSGEWVAPDSEITVWERENIVKIDAAEGLDYIRVELNGPNRAPLAVGTYQDVRNQLNGPAANPGILVIFRGLGCGDDYAEFVIYRIERDVSGQLVALEASFTQHCGSPDGPALNGHIHFQA
ncbi:hypothetical protein [Actinophytocola sp.]|uniref:hypothetical protein n=1 Tax=Actinophytocola sp. TaxID=1872138 RepID=UPI00389A94D9